MESLLNHFLKAVWSQKYIIKFFAVIGNMNRNLSFQRRGSHIKSLNIYFQLKNKHMLYKIIFRNVRKNIELHLKL